MRVVEIPEGGGQVSVGGLVKSSDPGVADSRLDHGVEVDAGAGNFVSHDTDNNWFIPPFAAEGNLDFGALGALQQVCYLGSIEAIAGLVVNLENDVAGADTGFIGRRANHWSYYIRVCFTGSYGHPDAVIAALLLFAEAGVLLGVKEVGVGV